LKVDEHGRPVEQLGSLGSTNNDKTTVLNPDLASLLSVLEVFHIALTRPSFANMLVVACGWILTHGPHAVTEALVMTGVAGSA
jgi:hypothetical protein